MSNQEDFLIGKGGLEKVRSGPCQKQGGSAGSVTAAIYTKYFTRLKRGGERPQDFLLLNFKRRFRALSASLATRIFVSEFQTPLPHVVDIFCDENFRC